MTTPLSPRPRLTAALAAGALLLHAGTAGALQRQRGPQEVAPLSADKPEPLFPANVAWTLTSLNGRPALDDPPSFNLDDKLRATGFSGCNTYSMTLFPVRGQKLAAGRLYRSMSMTRLFPVRGQKLAAGSIALTRKQCDKAVMAFERDFLVALHSLPTWAIEGSDLVITSPKAVLRFRRGV